MSDKSGAHAQHEAHSGGGLLSIRLVTTLFFALILPALAIVLLVNVVTRDYAKTEVSETAQALAVAQRIQKVGAIQLGSASHEAKSGEDVFKGRCSACHAAGMLGSPKFGDAAAWGPRIKAGFDSLWNSALHGKGNMTPQSGGDLSDFEIARGVVYMANAGGAKFPEPVAPEKK